jgi:transforming growth factor-beta-induced protein
MVNKKLFSVILATLITVGIVGGASVAFAQNVTIAQKTTIVTTAESQPTTFSSLVKALNATNLTGTLNDTMQNFTVFAPTNTAFAALGNVTLNDLLTNNTPKLKTILLDHVVKGRQNLTTNGSAQTLAGDTITWTVRPGAGEVYLGNSSANFTGNAATTSNGLVQPIDGVLTPPAGGTAVASASAAGGFLGLPGFEAVYAVAGLLVVAYLVMRRRR